MQGRLPTKYLNNQKSSIPILKDTHGQTISNDDEKATLLNDFFTQCFNSSVPSLENWSTDDYNLDPSYI